MPRSSKLFEMAAYLLPRPNRNSDASGFEVLGQCWLFASTQELSFPRARPPEYAFELTPKDNSGTFLRLERTLPRTVECGLIFLT